MLKRHACKSRGARRARRGFTLIELAIATSILMIGLVSVLSASSRMHSLRLSNRERTLAQNAMRSMAERMHATSHGFTDDPNTWAAELLAAYAPGGALGDTFSIEGLTPVDEQPQGSLWIGQDETQSDDDLGVELGLPRDLNGDGDASDDDVSEGARLLPVVLTLSWRGENGVQRMRHGFYLMGY